MSCACLLIQGHMQPAGIRITDRWPLILAASRAPCRLSARRVIEFVVARPCLVSERSGARFWPPCWFSDADQCLYPSLGRHVDDVTVCRSLGGHADVVIVPIARSSGRCRQCVPIARSSCRCRHCVSIARSSCRCRHCVSITRSSCRCRHCG